LGWPGDALLGSALGFFGFKWWPRQLGPQTAGPRLANQRETPLLLCRDGVRCMGTCFGKADSSFRQKRSLVGHPFPPTGYHLRAFASKSRDRAVPGFTSFARWAALLDFRRLFAGYPCCPPEGRSRALSATKVQKSTTQRSKRFLRCFARGSRWVNLFLAPINDSFCAFGWRATWE